MSTREGAPVDMSMSVEEGNAFPKMMTRSSGWRAGESQMQRHHVVIEVLWTNNDPNLVTRYQGSMIGAQQINGTLCGATI